MATLSLNEAVNMAVGHYNGGRLPEAEALCNAILASHATEYTALIILSLVHNRTGRPQTALALGQRALAARPDLHNSYVLMQQLLSEQGRADEASLWTDRGADLKARDTYRTRLAELDTVLGAPAPIGRDAVLGLAMRYSVEQIAPFVKSLRRTGFDGDVILLVSEVGDDVIRFLADWGVTAEPFETYNPAGFYLALVRFFKYYEILMRGIYQKRARYDRVLLTDVRDVYFQARPFPETLEHEVCFAMENPAQIIGTCPYNRGWIQAGFGDAVFTQIKDRRVTCSGTVLGSYAGIMRYLLKMQMLAFKLNRGARRHCGIDQGIHNYMFYLEPEPGWGPLENGNHILTVGGQTDLYRVDSRGEIRNLRGEVVPVVHQYDRQPALVELVQRQMQPANAA